MRHSQENKVARQEKKIRPKSSKKAAITAASQTTWLETIAFERKVNKIKLITEDKSVPVVDISELNLSIVVFEANLVDDLREWWVDTGATHYICLDKEMFSTYIPITSRKLLMGNFVIQH